MRSEANDSGKTFEYVIAAILESQKLAYKRQYKTKIVGDYDEVITVDFYVWNACGFGGGLYIEARWQESPGSVEKKANALKDSIAKYYDKPTIVVCGGAQVKRQYEVLRGAALVDGGTLVGVFRLEEFLSFACKLRGPDGVRDLKREFDPARRMLFAT